MKQKIKNDSNLANRMWWSLIISLIIALAGNKVLYPPASSDAMLFNEMPPEHRIFLAVCLFVLSALMMIRFIVFIFLRKKNSAKITKIKDTGIRTTGRVENIIEKGISVKYILEVSFTDPVSGERITAYSPRLNQDPRHYTNIGKDLPVYITANNNKNIYIDITD